MLYLAPPGSRWSLGWSPLCPFRIRPLVRPVGIRRIRSVKEMQQLADAMEAQFQRLKYGGRSVVITFKPKEDLKGMVVFVRVWRGYAELRLGDQPPATVGYRAALEGVCRWVVLKHPDMELLACRPASQHAVSNSLSVILSHAVLILSLSTWCFQILNSIGNTSSRTETVVFQHRRYTGNQ